MVEMTAAEREALEKNISLRKDWILNLTKQLDKRKQEREELEKAIDKLELRIRRDLQALQGEELSLKSGRHLSEMELIGLTLETTAVSRRV